MSRRLTHCRYVKVKLGYFVQAPSSDWDEGCGNMNSGRDIKDPAYFSRPQSLKFKTTHRPDTRNPEWNESHTYPEIPMNEHLCLHMTVRDWDKVGTNDFWGRAIVKVKDLVGPGKNGTAVYVPLLDRSTRVSAEDPHRHTVRYTLPSSAPHGMTKYGDLCFKITALDPGGNCESDVRSYFAAAMSKYRASKLDSKWGWQDMDHM